MWRIVQNMPVLLLRYIKDWVHVENARPKIMMFIYTLSNDYHAPLGCARGFTMDNEGAHAQFAHV